MRGRLLGGIIMKSLRLRGSCDLWKRKMGLIVNSRLLLFYGCLFYFLEEEEQKIKTCFL